MKPFGLHGLYKIFSALRVNCNWKFSIQRIQNDVCIIHLVLVMVVNLLVKRAWCINLYNAEIFLYKPWRPKGYCQFGIIINVLVSCFRFIWIPMLSGLLPLEYFHSFSAGSVFIRQHLTSTDVRCWRKKTVPSLKGLIIGDVLFCICFRCYLAKLSLK